MQFLNTCIKEAFISLYTDLSHIHVILQSLDFYHFLKTEMHLEIIPRFIVPFRTVLISGEKVWNVFVFFGITDASLGAILKKKPLRFFAINDFSVIFVLPMVRFLGKLSIS